MRFIELSTREDAIRRLFVPFGPVIGLKVQQDPKPDEYGKMTKFAHVRFVVPEAASLAIEQTNNTKLEGSTIRVRCYTPLLCNCCLLVCLPLQ